MSELSSRFTAKEVENKWYAYWESNGFFDSVPDERPAYSIVIPPPNVTGVLHMGHMLNNTIQDILIRKARMSGYNACWVPGTDHASIATEAKVVKMLREKGIKKSDLTRDEFLKYAWEWKEEYGGIILNQLRKLGASCDWKRTGFTMDEVRSHGVLKVFVDLYRKDKLYRKKRMVNWDPEAKTVLSNEEVLFGLEQSKLYKVKYQIEGTNDFITIATTRPETIPGDTAVAVHPDDPRYQHLKGKRAIVPIINRSVPIIFDEYVTIDFGTGALKVTPAHDVNDFELGEKHQLEVIDIFNEDGTLSNESPVYQGVDRFKVRKLFSKDLEEAGHIDSVEDYQNNVGRSERTNAVVEPRLSLQWYVDMKAIAGPALDAVMKDEVEFFPKNQKNIYKHWMENIKDWCISRQLWWGHRIPAWYYQDEVFVAETADEALNIAQQKYPNLVASDLVQDEDVLDTWFSSWLWPITLFDGFRDQKELDYYYPTSVLVTGWDIIFLWVARMIMAGYEWIEKPPFHHVYFTGMVRDKLRRKMSKSLGNSPDALKLIEDYGADGVRFGMLSCSPAGGDLLFDEKLCEQGRNFNNKLWNAMRLLQGLQQDNTIAMSDVDHKAITWINERFDDLTLEIEQCFEQYRLSDALMRLYNFIWDDFCSWYLEMIKPEYGSPISKATYDETTKVFLKICAILHPFMPFITEEIWDQLKEEGTTSNCINAAYPKASGTRTDVSDKVEMVKAITSNIRDIRNKNGLKPKELLMVQAIESQVTTSLLSDLGYVNLLRKIGFLEDITLASNTSADGVAFVVGTDQFEVILEKEIDIAAEIEAKKKELEYQIGFVNSVASKLNNEKFVGSAPAIVVEKERQKMADGNERIKLLEQEIEKLGKLL